MSNYTQADYKEALDRIPHVDSDDDMAFRKYIYDFEEIIYSALTLLSRTDIAVMPDVPCRKILNAALACMGEEKDRSEWQKMAYIYDAMISVGNLLKETTND